MNAETDKWPSNGGEIGNFMRGHDWRGSKLGEPHEWPHSLKTMIDFQLASPVAMNTLWGSDLVQFYNNAFRRLVGARHPDALGTPLLQSGYEPSAAERTAYQTVLSGQSLRVPDQILDGNGEDRPRDLVYSPLRNESGEVVGVFLMALDKGEVSSHAVNGEGAGVPVENLPVAELQHRVRNMLAVMRSLVRRTAENSLSVEDFAMHLEGRIDAFARIETALARGPHSSISLADLIADEFNAAAAKEGQQFTLEGDEIALRPQAAEKLALAVHELATNAIKHGALSVPEGRIHVSWSVRPLSEGQGEALDLEWRETGVTPGPLSRRGFGTDLLERSLSYELNARVSQSLEADGFHCSIQLPVEKIAA